MKRRIVAVGGMAAADYDTHTPRSGYLLERGAEGEGREGGDPGSGGGGGSLPPRVGHYYNSLGRSPDILHCLQVTFFAVRSTWINPSLPRQYNPSNPTRVTRTQLLAGQTSTTGPASSVPHCTVLYYDNITV